MICPYCNKNTTRVVRTKAHKTRKKQKYVFSEWDKCSPCGYIKHYEIYKMRTKEWLKDIEDNDLVIGAMEND